jgi:NAD(P)-dependent dehydrogenase (short-subunit alcohol dehydrogenase family)
LCFGDGFIASSISRATKSQTGGWSEWWPNVWRQGCLYNGDGGCATADEADWTDGFALKFFCAVRLTRAAWPHLKARHGTVLNIIGAGGTHSRSRLHDRRLGERRLPIIYEGNRRHWHSRRRPGKRDQPGPVRTDRFKLWLAAEAANHGGDQNAALQAIVRKSNIVRIGEPEDVASLAAYMVSPQSRYLQGALIDLDGGQTKTI